MKTLICVLAIGLWSGAALAQSNMDWAYPVTPKPEPLDSVHPKQAPGSAKKYTQAQIDDPFNPPDWFPDEHPAMPQIVAHGGAKPAGRACAQCHLPTGNGHPESASLAGLNVNYIVRQMAAFKNGERKGIRPGVMIAMAKVLSDAEVKEAADYFAALKPTAGYNKVTEVDKVPATYVGAGGMRFALGDGGFEPIGSRIIVLPQNPDQAAMRSPKFGFVDYVPKGSLVKGAALMAGGEGKTISCTICHGPTLKGLAEVPGIAGRPATYIFRQLNDMKTGNRAGGWVELMKPVVAKLDQDDMIALAAYLGSLDP
jgi:cytochrome c553